MATPKGLIFLEHKSAIMHEQLMSRLLEGKREPCEISFADFDGVSFRMSSQPETVSVVKINMAINGAADLLRFGASDLLDELFPGMVTSPDAGFDVAIEFDCENVADPEEFLESISLLKRHVIGGPIRRALAALDNGTSDSLEACAVSFRKGEEMYITPSDSKIFVAFLIDFADATDKAMARVFLQEFVEAQRTVRSGPTASFAREPLREIASLVTNHNPDAAGYITFALEKRHLEGGKIDNAVSLMASFRNYLHYHIKASKTYLHMRMRKRVVGWLQVLNRAVPQIQTAKKLASGKTFTRK
jgi:actin related protein 2/3 complex subunit 2